MNSKYSNMLTIILILIIVAIVGIIGFLGFKYYQKHILTSSAENFVDDLQNDETSNNKNPANGNKEDKEGNKDEEIEFGGVDENENTGNSSGTTEKKFNGFLTSGAIEIPSTNLKCPILAQSEYSTKALDTSVIELYGDGLNKPGVTTIVGHNYRRSGVFFSDNKKINKGDKIFITDLSGRRLAYTVYDKFETTENDTSFMVKDTEGKIEIALQTCTDDSSKRLIILARADV